ELRERNPGFAFDLGPSRAVQAHESHEVERRVAVAVAEADLGNARLVEEPAQDEHGSIRQRELAQQTERRTAGAMLCHADSSHNGRAAPDPHGPRPSFERFARTLERGTRRRTVPLGPIGLGSRSSMPGWLRPTTPG